MSNAEHTLELAVQSYKAHPHNPTRLAELNQELWYSLGPKMGVSKGDLVVADCLYSRDQIRIFSHTRGKENWIEAEFGLFVPQIVSTPEGLHLLQKGNPTLSSMRAPKVGSIDNVDKDGKPVELYGWMSAEKKIFSPHTGLDQSGAENWFREMHRIGHTLNVYLVAGMYSRLLTGEYFDQLGDITRLLSTRVNGSIVCARFDQTGHCYISTSDIPSLAPNKTRLDLGARSVKLAAMIQAIIFDFNRTVFDPQSNGLFPEVMDVLRELKSRQIRMALVSRGDDPDQRRQQIADLGLNEFFKKIEVVGKGGAKDFGRILRVLKVRGQHCAVVGDKIVPDIREGNRIRSVTIWVRREGAQFANDLPETEADKPTFEFDSLRPLPAVIDRLNHQAAPRLQTL